MAYHIRAMSGVDYAFRISQTKRNVHEHRVRSHRRTADVRTERYFLVARVDLASSRTVPRSDHGQLVSTATRQQTNRKAR